MKGLQLIMKMICNVRPGVERRTLLRDKILKAALPSWLSSPLSVQKRIRAVTQRRARQERLGPYQSRELDVADFQQQDQNGVTQLCKTINPTLNKLLNEVYAAEEADDE